MRKRSNALAHGATEEPVAGFVEVAAGVLIQRLVVVLKDHREVMKVDPPWLAVPVQRF